MPPRKKTTKTTPKADEESVLTVGWIVRMPISFRNKEEYERKTAAITAQLEMKFASVEVFDEDDDAGEEIDDETEEVEDDGDTGEELDFDDD